jgi:hypothetical protein
MRERSRRRWWLIAAALVATVAGVVWTFDRMNRRVWAFERSAAEMAQQEQTFRDQMFAAQAGRPPGLSEEESAACDIAAMRDRARAEYYGRLKRLHLRVASHPWESLPPVPPAP